MITLRTTYLLVGKSGMMELTLNKTEKNTKHPSLNGLMKRKDNMSYKISYTGELSIVGEVTLPLLKELNSILGEDCRDHPEWVVPRDLYYIDLALTQDMTGLCMDKDVEYTTDIDKQVHTVIQLMQKKFPDFNLRGSLQGQGREPEDKTLVYMNKDGTTVNEKTLDTLIEGETITCPSCNYCFCFEGKGDK